MAFMVRLWRRIRTITYLELYHLDDGRPCQAPGYLTQLSKCECELFSNTSGLESAADGDVRCRDSANVNLEARHLLGGENPVPILTPKDGGWERLERDSYCGTRQ